MATALNRQIPGHVPQHLVVTLPLFSRTTIDENPHEVLVPHMHRTLPPICYGTNIFPGDQPSWLLMQAEDVHGFLRDSENFTKNGMMKFAQCIGEDWIILPTETDPPVHAGYRQAMNPYFSPSQMLATRDQLRARARNLIAAFKGRGECDFIQEFSENFPIYVTLDMLGLPHDRVADFLAWEKIIMHGNDWEERARTVRLIKDYLVGEIDKRYKEPRDDYISKIIAFEINGRKWTPDEVFGHCFNLYTGGLDTVTSMLGNVFRFFAENPGHQAEVRDEPAKIPIAIEELLRAYAPTTIFRVATRPMKIQGETIMPGDYVTVSTAVYGRDAAVYDKPDEIRFDRKPKHIALGDGIHRCLGMHLARLEMQIACEEFFAAIPPFRIKDGTRARYFAGNVVHVKGLHLQWN